MALSEQRVLSQVTIIRPQSAINVQWSNQILRDDEIIGETYERKAYTANQRAEFELEVEDHCVDLDALGW